MPFRMLSRYALNCNGYTANLGKSFTSGQAYVGLSRCTSLEGIELVSPIPRHAIKVDRAVVEFAQQFQEQNLSALEQEVREVKGKHYFKKPLSSCNPRSSSPRQ